MHVASYHILPSVHLSSSHVPRTCSLVLPQLWRMLLPGVPSFWARLMPPLLPLLPSVCLSTPSVFLLLLFSSPPGTNKQTNNRCGNAGTCTTRAAIPSVSRWSNLDRSRDAYGDRRPRLAAVVSRAIRFAYRALLVPSRFLFTALARSGCFRDEVVPRMKSSLKDDISLKCGIPRDWEYSPNGGPPPNWVSLKWGVPRMCVGVFPKFLKRV